MRYFVDTFEGEEFWIELGGDGYAVRQMILKDNKAEVSCLTDCLAEGKISLKELAGTIKMIDQKEFETKWNELLQDRKKVWEQKKKEYLIGKLVSGKLKYYYPQGAVIQLDGILGICSEELPSSLMIGATLQCCVAGYDEINLWIVLELPDRI